MFGGNQNAPESKHFIETEVCLLFQGKVLLCELCIFNIQYYTQCIVFCVLMCIMLGLSLIVHHSPFMGETKGRIGNWNFLWGLGLGIGSGLIQQGLKFASEIRTQLFLHRSSFLF